MSQLAEKLKEHGVIPDILPESIADILELATVTWSTTGAQANLGEEIAPKLVRQSPAVSWTADPDQLYTLLFIDPDAPSRTDPKKHCCKHWLVVNIPGSQLDKGHTETAYVGCGPPEGTGLHRYIFLVYRQSKPLAVSSTINDHLIKGRIPFDAASFAKEKGLHGPVAVTFFQAQYDDSVPEIQKRMMQFPYLFSNMYQLFCIKLFH